MKDLVFFFCYCGNFVRFEKNLSSCLDILTLDSLKVSVLNEYVCSSKSTFSAFEKLLKIN